MDRRTAHQDGLQPFPRTGGVPGRRPEPYSSQMRNDQATAGRMSIMEKNEPVNLTDALASFDEIYSPRIVARMNDYDVRIAKTQGDHVWHAHDHTDEFFLVLDGQLMIDIKGADTVTLEVQQGYTVPKGVVHRTRAAERTAILMVESAGVDPTGD